MDRSQPVESVGPGQHLDPWLDDMAAEPLPGGVAAAAVAAAMGAALVTKAARVTLRRQDAADTDRARLQAVLDLADQSRKVLVRLVSADVDAYRAVLEGQARGEAWSEAIEAPLRLAESCHALLEALPQLLGTCWPAVKPDAETGGWLLQAGVRAGLLAAESNLRAWADRVDGGSIRARIDRCRL